MNSSTPETQCAEDIYQMELLLVVLNFTNKTSRSS